MKYKKKFSLVAMLLLGSTLNGQNWLQRGTDFDGEAAGDQLGTAVALSSDGNVLAVGSKANDDGASDAGHVRIYHWNQATSAWNQRGSNINGEGFDNFFGHSISLSSDGNIIAIGAPGNRDNGSYAGHVRVYSWNAGSSTWVKLGNSLTGEAAWDYFGTSVSLSSNGATLAVGAPGNSNTNGLQSGHTRVFDWNTGTSSWVQRGTDIDGEAIYDGSGMSVSLSSDGNTLAIGAPGNSNSNGQYSGHTRVYVWNSGSSSWNQRGNDIDGEAQNDNSGGTGFITSDGRGVSISADGNTLAIGAYANSGNGNYAGHVRVYTWNNATSNWTQQGADIDGDTADDAAGYSIALSENGKKLAIGAPKNSGNGINSGQVRIFYWDGTTWTAFGNDVAGEAAEDLFGSSIALSSDGLILAAGAPYNDGNGSYAGNVRVFNAPCILSITSQSKSKTIASGKNTFFNLITNSSDALYQWQINTGSGWKNLTNNSSINGVHEDTLNLISVTPFSHGNRFRCITSEGNCHDTSDVMTLSVTLGDDIDGEFAGDNSGSSISMSENGNILAIGAPLNDGNSSNEGHARVFEWNGTSWNQRGSDINGENNSDLSGAAVSLSSDGNTLAIGAYYNDGNGSASGHVRVFKWNGSGWIQLGNDIDGEATLDLSGSAVAISSDGYTLAIGAYNNDGGGTNSGHVRVYQWNGTTWVKLGADIDGESANDQSGVSIAISDNGSKVAIGANYNDGGGADAGHVRVFEWNGTNWTQLGSDIDGEAPGDQLGLSVSLSADGNILAAGASYNDGNGTSSGHARIYSWNGTNWIQIGNDIEGENVNDHRGNAVSLSSNGKVVGIGSSFSNANGSRSGSASVFYWNGLNWNKINPDMNGETADDYFGTTVSLAGDGSKIAIGTPNNDGNGSSAGHVRVFPIPCFSSITTQPSNRNVIPCSQTIFTIAVNSANPTYQWQTNTGSGWNNLANNSLFSGVTEDTLIVNAATMSMNGNSYRCVVSSGSCTDSSVSVSMNISSKSFTWDGNGAGLSFFKDSNWLENTVPCPAANVIFNYTSNKHCVIGDTLQIADFSATTAYSGRLKMEGSKAAIFADDIDLRGSMFTAEKNSGKISCDSFSLTFNGYAETGGAGLDAASLFYVRGSRFSARSNAVMNLNHFYLDRMGVFTAPGDNGAVNLIGNFTREFVSNFNPGNGTWNFSGDQNSSLDPGVGTNNPVRVVFHNLNIAKTDSNTLSIANNDTIQVNGNFAVSGTNSRVQGGVLNAKGNISMGKSWLDGAFNRVLITGTSNQTITCDTASEFSETVVLHKPSGKVLLGKDLSLGSVRFNSGILDPNGKKFILTGNDISGQNVQSNIKDRAYVLKTNGAFSGNSITVPLSNGDGLSLNSISLNTSGSHNDWQLDYVAGNPSDLDADLDASLTSICSTGYWRVQRLSSSAGSAETFLKILAGFGFNQVAILDGGAWRSIGGNVSGNSITSTESNLFASTGDWYITAGKMDEPGAPNPVTDDEDETNVTNPNVILSLSKDDQSMNGAYQNALRQAQGDRQGDILVYPNPAQQILHIQLPEGAQRFSINDLSGRVLASYNAGQQQVNISKLSEGMYLISTDINGKKYTVRFVKE